MFPHERRQDRISTLPGVFIPWKVLEDQKFYIISWKPSCKIKQNEHFWIVVLFVDGPLINNYSNERALDMR